MKGTRIITKTYAVSRDYVVDIVKTRDAIDAYLYKRGNTHRLYMFGTPKVKDYDEFLNMVEANYEDYIGFLHEEERALEDYYNKKFYR